MGSNEASLLNMHTQEKVSSSELVSKKIQDAAAANLRDLTVSF